MYLLEKVPRVVVVLSAARHHMTTDFLRRAASHLLSFVAAPAGNKWSNKSLFGQPDERDASRSAAILPLLPPVIMSRAAAATLETPPAAPAAPATLKRARDGNSDSDASSSSSSSSSASTAKAAKKDATGTPASAPAVTTTTTTAAEPAATPTLPQKASGSSGGSVMKITQSFTAEVSNKDKTHICDICQKGSKTPAGLRSHRARYHPVEYKAQLQHPRTMPIVKKKKATATAGTPGESSSDFQCSHPGCTKVYSLRDSLQKHIDRKHRGKEAELFACTGDPGNCSKKFYTRNEWLMHTVRRHPEVLVEEQARLQSEQQQQQQTTAATTAAVAQPTTTPVVALVPSYQCTHCSKIYKASPSLLLHIRRAHGEKKHNCTCCDATFAVRGDLNHHIRRKHTARAAVAEAAAEQSEEEEDGEEEQDDDEEEKKVAAADEAQQVSMVV